MYPLVEVTVTKLVLASVAVTAVDISASVTVIFVASTSSLT